MVDHRWQLGHLGARAIDTRSAFGVIEADQISLIGDVDFPVDESQSIRSIEPVDEGGLQIGLPIAVAVAQQGDAVAAFDRAFAALLDHSGDDVLRTDSRGVSTRSFGNQYVAIGQKQHLPRDFKVFRNRSYRETFGYGRKFAVPAFGRGNFHGGQERVALLRKVGPFACLIQVGIALRLARGERSCESEKDDPFHARYSLTWVWP